MIVFRLKEHSPIKQTYVSISCNCKHSMVMEDTSCLELVQKIDKVNGDNVYQLVW